VNKDFKPTKYRGVRLQLWIYFKLSIWKVFNKKNNNKKKKQHSSRAVRLLTELLGKEYSKSPLAFTTFSVRKRLVYSYVLTPRHTGEQGQHFAVPLLLMSFLNSHSLQAAF